MRPWHPLLDGLAAPLRWRNRVQVRLTQELFLDDVPREFIDQVFAVMMLAPMHTFKVTTKGSISMGRYMEQQVSGLNEGFSYANRIALVQCDLLQQMSEEFAESVCDRYKKHTGLPLTGPQNWPPSNVYLYGELRP